MAIGSVVAAIASEGESEEAELAGHSSQLHHIATDKAIVSGFTEQFEKIFARAGKDLQWSENLMELEGHAGRHARAYHEFVLEKLSKATNGLVGKDAERALGQALRELRAIITSNPDILKGGPI